MPPKGAGTRAPEAEARQKKQEGKEQSPPQPQQGGEPAKRRLKIYQSKPKSGENNNIKLNNNQIRLKLSCYQVTLHSELNS